MERVRVAASCLLLTVAGVTAQTGQDGGRLVPQWLTGLIAMTIFLLLAFAFFVGKRVWCEKPSRRRSGDDDESVGENELVMTNGGLEVNRTNEERNAFDNQVFDSSDATVTPM